MAWKQAQKLKQWLKRILLGAGFAGYMNYEPVAKIKLYTSTIAVLCSKWIMDDLWSHCLSQEGVPATG